MPRRTNDFQKLIARIYKQMAAADESVTESAMVRERGDGTEREIDVLLEKRVFGTIIRIAVECRGRHNKDDIMWIDGLIGKYRDLPINKVVAVSKSGFTAAAQGKAHANGIDTLTLKIALETDWPSEFVRLAIVKITRHDRPRNIQLFTDGTLISSLDISAPLFSEEGEQIGNLEQFAHLLYENNKENITTEIQKRFLSFFKTVEDFQKHQVLVGIPVTPAHPTFIDDRGKRIKVTQITLEMLCSFSYEPRNVSHYVFGDSQITQATITDEQSKGEFTITAIQEANKPNHATVRIERVTIPTVK